MDAAADVEGMAGDPAAIVGGQERNRVSDVVRLAEAAERGHPDQVPLGSSGTNAVSLVAVTGDGMMTLESDPHLWFEHLCQINDRDYTDEERELLPAGADPTRPCETG